MGPGAGSSPAPSSRLSSVPATMYTQEISVSVSIRCQNIFHVWVVMTLQLHFATEMIQFSNNGLDV